MKLAIRMLAWLVLPAVLAVTAGSRAEEAVKAGRWEFQTQIGADALPPLPAGVSLPAGIEAEAGGGIKATHRQCIQPDKEAPTDPRAECKISGMQRSGNVMTWTTTCDGPQGTVVSTGTARYRGDTMEANLNARVPDGKGGFIETKQKITGRYLGPC